MRRCGLGVAGPTQVSEVVRSLGIASPMAVDLDTWDREALYREVVQVWGGAHTPNKPYRPLRALSLSFASAIFCCQKAPMHLHECLHAEWRLNPCRWRSEMSYQGQPIRGENTHKIALLVWTNVNY
eukprot:7451279-Pyramimonas_sp.AAC.2